MKQKGVIIDYLQYEAQASYCIYIFRKVLMNKFFYILILTPLLFAACGKKDPGAKQNNQIQSSQNNAGEIKSNSSELTLSKGLPEDFPADLPKPLNGEAKGYFKSSDGTIVNFISSSSFKEVTDFYVNEFKKNGFTPLNSDDSKFEDKLFVSDFTKDGRKVNLIITKDENLQRLNIVLTY